MSTGLASDRIDEDLARDALGDLDDWRPSKRSQPLVIYYVTAHGWGHLTRSVAITFELLCQRSLVLLSRLAEAYAVQRFDTETLSTLLDQVRVRCIQLDVGCIQINALAIDAAATLAAYTDIEQHRTELVQREASFLRLLRPQLLLTDAVTLAAVAAKEAALADRFLFVTNFFFSAIYAGFIKADPALDTPRYRALIQRMVADEALAAVWVQLTPGIVPPLEPFPGDVFAVPPVSRPWKHSRQETRDSLGINADTMLLLVCFGSFDCKALFGNADALLRPFLESVDLVRMANSPWVIVVLVEGLSEASSPRVRLVDSTDHGYVPDLVRAADVVLGKLGYGICAECLAGRNTSGIRSPTDLRRRGLSSR
ncbi:hypothetical protein F1559_004268 [Cyanidiococcus yangmingshanensis]|uniref:Uncharacterized protein n=1 Tax=Cyanidiococcus yangmingshanensis TaxID=2690220 RepID=A0A7J7IKP4_9RHOD|nr:hypothetical protein F1559_004268 [Cyanidiococcus yangmingshanensis]